MGRNIVKVLEKKFADMKAGDRMYISSPEEIKSFIINIPRGTSKSLKEMRLDLANTKGADNTCPCLLYTSPSPRDAHESRMPSSA